MKLIKKIVMMVNLESINKSKFFKSVFDTLDQLFHFVLAKFTEVMLEIKVFCHQAIKLHDVQQVIFMNPL